MYHTKIYHSPLGDILLESDGRALRGLWFREEPSPRNGVSHAISRMVSRGEWMPRAVSHGGLPVFEQTERWLNLYFQGEVPDFTPPLALDGSPFRVSVWQILLNIPHGQIRTYGDIAREIAALTGVPRMSAQAVGGAVGHNPVSIIVPCHRVVGTGGNLTGYGGGMDRKIRLLELERLDMSQFHMPGHGSAL